MDTSTDLIKIESSDDNILHLRLNRPHYLNALNHDLLQELMRLLEEAAASPTIKAILLSGEGKAFCAGADIKELEALNGQAGLQFARFGQAVMRKLETIAKPSLAAVHGYALGGGCELAMAATLRIATDHCVFAQPEIKLGVIPGFGGTQRLARLVGRGRALELCLTGRRFSAAEALQWGMLSELTQAENLLERAQTLLQEIIQFSPCAIQNTISSIQEGYDLSLQAGLEFEAAHFALCCASQDKQEGVRAFLEKRKPVFNGT